MGDYKHLLKAVELLRYANKKYHNLWEEKERLRKENIELRETLKQMQNENEGKS